MNTKKITDFYPIIPPKPLSSESYKVRIQNQEFSIKDKVSCKSLIGRIFEAEEENFLSELIIWEVSKRSQQKTKLPPFSRAFIVLN
jgi:hypothetical protein